MNEWQRMIHDRYWVGGAISGALMVLAILGLEGGHPKLGTVLWGLSCLAWLAVWAFADNRPSDRAVLAPLRISRLDLGIAAGLTLWGLGWRLWQLDVYPTTLLYDEAHFGWQALSVLEGAIPHPLTTGYRSHPVLFGVAQAAPLALFDHSIASLRMASAWIGSLAVGATYGLGRLLWTRRCGLLAALMLSTYPFHLHFSRLGLNNIVDTLIGPLAFVWVVVCIRTNRMGAAAAAGIVAGLGFYGYHGARLFPLIAILALAVSGKPWIRAGGVLLGGWILAISPLVWGILTGTADAGQPMWETSLLNPETFRATTTTSGLTPGALLIDQARRSFLALHVIPDSREFYRFNGGLARGLIGVWMTIGMVVGVYRWRDRGVQICGIWLVGGLVFGSLLMTLPPSSARLITVSVPIVLLAAYGLDGLLRPLNRFGEAGARVSMILMVALGLLTAADGIRTYFWEYAPQRYIGTPGDFEATEVGKALADIAAGSQIILVESQPPIYNRESLLWLTNRTPMITIDASSLASFRPPASPWIIVAPVHYCPILAQWSKSMPGGQWATTPSLASRGLGIPDGWESAVDPTQGLYCLYGTAINN